MMNKVFYLFLSLTLFSLSAFGGQPISLKQAVDGTYSPQTYSGIQPLAGTDDFVRISEDSKSIIQYSFKTGNEVGTFFDTETARGPKIRKIDGYIISPDGSRLLIQTETEHIYRHSKKAEYYIYSVQNKTLEPLSKGKLQEPLFNGNTYEKE